MTDRELLEAAAKAAGIDATAYYGPSDEFWGLVVDSTGIEWNPLEDDGDALRLAVKLGFYDLDELVCRFADDPRIDPSADPYAATRRAIVRAAAAIGGAKP